ncbi:MAG: orotate phosphoribosyltransferase [Kiritimatiellae bacterium]|nr:orotate phosphoribosyltransferase [Kiritimatiellia bacterium]
MKSTEIIEILKNTGALLEGHFELRSGLHSDRFFQCANLLSRPLYAQQCCEALVEKMTVAGVLNDVDTVVAPALGGIVVGHEVAREMGVKSIFVEKQDDKLYLRRFKIAPGERIVIAEDVVTRGGRVQETIDIVKDAGGIVVAIALLVNRSGGKVDFGYPTFSLLEMEPVTWEPAECPLCEQGLPLVHPGS